MTYNTIKRALISVFDKTGIVEFAKVLTEKNVEIISTGGTAKALREAGVPVIELGDYTGFPEMLGGRVKTLHPKVHGGLLYVRGNAEHEATVAEHNIPAIDLVVVNLYPFEQTLARPGVSAEEIIENIDIGGPAMLRSSSKNFASVTVVTDPTDYAEIAEDIREHGGTTLERRRALAGKVFALTSGYDTAIAQYFARDTHAVPEKLTISAPRVQALRYGENPHQRAGLYGKFNDYFTQLQGKELSYNNILDLTAAAELIQEFKNDAPTIAILKHTNPCGVGQSEKLVDAWHKAFATDTQAPFGGIIASNVEIDTETATAIREIFTEVIIAPSFSAEALALFAEKKNLRIMILKKDPTSGGEMRVRSVGAESYVLQDADIKELNESDLKVATKRAPTTEEMKGLLFAYKVGKHIKSNAIVFASGTQTLGVGAGQMSRIDSTRIAAWKAKEVGLSLQGSSLASDAFFPFPDGLIAAHDAGATAVIQPGGALKDAEVIAAADERNMAMVFTGMRHFRH